MGRCNKSNNSRPLNVLKEIHVGVVGLGLSNLHQWLQALFSYQLPPGGDGSPLMSLVVSYDVFSFLQWNVRTATTVCVKWLDSFGLARTHKFSEECRSKWYVWCPVTVSRDPFTELGQPTIVVRISQQEAGNARCRRTSSKTKAAVSPCAFCGRACNHKTCWRSRLARSRARSRRRRLGLFFRSSVE